mmetsp:Transcript_27167/g.63188  ORF Transcript_27167/g.63188 Transcript_27167/m.63188 type:complete len:580 (-) Transcript_27167:181-1920(-)
MNQTMSITVGMQEYIQSMVDRISGMKVLILDAETLGIISMVYSQSDILQHEVFLVERIDAEQHEKMRHLNAICFLRPTTDNFLKLTKELKNPKYQEYHLFFTNVVLHTRLEQLAAVDEYEVVHQVQEYYADVFAVNHDLFSLNLPSTSRLTEERSSWSSYEESLFDRTVEGLLAACLALRMMPHIRYQSSSDLARTTAEKLNLRIREEQVLFDGLERERKSENTPVVLLLDRRNDPVTPLLNQWTYQAMLHELLHMDNNRIDMSKVPDIRPELKEIVMSSMQDQFFEENMLANFGDLGVSIKNYLETYQRETKNTAKIESIEEMQKFVDQYPEFRRMSGNVSKHVAVVHELSRIVDAQALLQASQLEQEIACSENRQEHFKALVDMVNGTSITHMERLRLALLFALRYEHDSSNAQIKALLRRTGIMEDQISLMDDVLRYAGSSVRSGDLFQNKSLLNIAKSSVIKGFKGVENVYTQHKSHLHGVVDSLLKGKLKESSYPYVEDKRHTTSANQKEGRARSIVFILGGTTFEEARDIAELNAREGGRWVVLGGTTIHNARSFLADVAQLGSRMGPHGGID